jgi:hypothetical protein
MLTLAAVGCSHRIGLLVAGRAGNRLVQGDRIANYILADRHSPAGHTAAEAAGSPAAAGRSPGCIDRNQTY